ncbi:hypothetical protein MMC07_004233 [Pseudocyphellaria aurata]|nr:hypothetical protein [Pseudocyphellaria aurata]
MRASNFYDDASLRAAKKSCVMILAYLIVSSTTIAAEETCYFPNGNRTEDVQKNVLYYPCREGNSTCCAVNEACISNGLCFSSKTDMMYRGACTNPDWIGCPTEYCNDLQPGMFANLWNCAPPGGTTDGGSYWWCGGGSASVCHVGDGASTFSIKQGLLQTIIEGPASTSLTTTSTSSTTAGISSSPASIVESPPLTITASATAAVENGRSGESSKSSNVPVAVGAGVGIPLVAAALGFLGILIWRELRKRRRGDKVVLESTQQEHSPTSGATVIQQSSPGELTGHMVESELVAPAPVHEIQQSSPRELTGHMFESELVAPARVHELYARPRTRTFHSL